MAEKTANYALSLLEATDRMEREALNGNWGKVDEALGEKAELVVGSYTGNGVNGRTINLGFTPKSVFICHREGITALCGAYVYGGLFLPAVCLQANGKNAAEIVEGGIKLYKQDDHSQVNISGVIYLFWALR